MKSSAKKVELAPYDDLFSTEESRQDAKLEKVREIPLSELHPFKNHPFKVKDDEAMLETADSVRQYGILVPAIARPDPEGGYELVAGHRRHRASELAEKETMGNFTFEETNLLCIYNTGSRTGLIEALTEMCGELSPEEAELRELTDSALSKLRAMSDAEFAELELYPDFDE